MGSNEVRLWAIDEPRMREFLDAVAALRDDFTVDGWARFCHRLGWQPGDIEMFDGVADEGMDKAYTATILVHHTQHPDGSNQLALHDLSTILVDEPVYVVGGELVSWDGPADVLRALLGFGGRSGPFPFSWTEMTLVEPAQVATVGASQMLERLARRGAELSWGGQPGAIVNALNEQAAALTAFVAAHSDDWVVVERPGT